MTQQTQPYWLIREGGKKHGFDTVQLDVATTSEEAMAASMKRWEETWEGSLFYPEGATATLVILTYEGDVPVVKEVK